MAKDTILVITVEYQLALTDEKAARILGSLAEEHGVNFGSKDWGIWDFSPSEKVTSIDIR